MWGMTRLTAEDGDGDVGGKKWKRRWYEKIGQGMCDEWKGTQRKPKSTHR